MEQPELLEISVIDRSRLRDSKRTIIRFSDGREVALPVGYDVWEYPHSPWLFLIPFFGGAFITALLYRLILPPFL